MKASAWEFKNRALIFGLIFGCSFLLYAIDQQNSVGALADWLARRFGANSDMIAHWLLAAAAAVVGMAALVRTWASSYLAAEVVYASEVKTQWLVADGPYRRVRNPLYFGNVLLAIGLGAMMSRPGCIIAVVAMLIFNYRLIFREEAELEVTQGENYRRYMKQVPRLLPSLTARTPASGAKARWAGGFKAEFWCWGVAMALVAFAITLRISMFYIILGASILLLWVSSTVLYKRSNARG